MIVLFLLGALLALGIAAYTYTRREPAGRGRRILIALRTATLLLIVLLLIDPKLRGVPARASAPRVIVDASLSMTLDSAWHEAVAEAARAQGVVLLAGEDVRAVQADSLAHFDDFAGESRVLPALQRAAEAGAQRVTLITDGSIDDADDVARWLPVLGITLDVRSVAGATTPNRAIASVEAPSWAEAGKTLTFRVHTQGTARLPATILVMQDGKAIARTDSSAVSFVASGPKEGGLVRYDVAFETRDSIPGDDVRSVYVYVSEKPAGVAIVSFDPDWEPRFLHPVIADALGLPVQTFLRVPAGVYFRAGNGADAGSRVEESSVLRAVRDADLLVLHGMSSAAPEWAQQAARSARRLIVFPAEAGIEAPLRTSGATPADWYIAPDLPPSPILGFLADIDVRALPPLNSLQTAALPEGAWAPLLAGRTPRSGRSPALAAAARDGRRWVVALGSGYWRWAFRPGESQDAYNRLWGALAGWVVQDNAAIAASAIRPLQRAVPRAMPVRWIAPGIAADSFVLSMRAANGSVQREVIAVQPGDTAVSRRLAPGHYTYDIRAIAGSKEVARAAGPLTVESYSAELMRHAVDVDRLETAPIALSSAANATGRPLHTFSWLYMLLVALLCAEWILRRRWGLR